MGDRDKPGAEPMSASSWAKGTAKSPDDFDEQDEPMTDEQAAQLKVLSQEANEPFTDSLTRTAAERRIDELQQKTGKKP
ncbi:DUF3072 domain-containing protein [Virgifigura deserti]|uniref:DUF3072 domain-containing protein n=1 Tax=Virgifigura deserti TaxID=2268457 RepID=UPI003CCBD4FA